MTRYAGRVGTGDGWGDLAQGAKGERGGPKARDDASSGSNRERVV
jgi:hypothetical protein